MNWQLARYAATLRYISPATRYDMASNPDSQTPPTSNPNSSAPCGVSQGKIQEGRPRGFCFDNPRVQDATCQRLVYCRIPAVCPVIRDAGETRAEFFAGRNFMISKMKTDDLLSYLFWRGWWTTWFLVHSLGPTVSASSKRSWRESRKMIRRRKTNCWA